MTRAKRILQVLVVLALAGLLSGWSRQSEPSSAGKYLEPRFPSYLKPPRSVEDVMPWARRLVVNKAARGGLGLGAAQKGDTILIVLQESAEPMILEGIRRALAERSVKVQTVYDYDLVGVSRADVQAVNKARKRDFQYGYLEASGWMESQFANPEVPKKWLKERRPDLYNKLFPASRELSPQLNAAWQKLRLDSIGQGIQAYLKKHPEVKGVYFGKGGGAGLLRALHPMESKFMGFFIYDNRWEAMSEIPPYPADVWQLSEEQSMEPVAYADKIHVTDPEGTDLACDITEEMAQRWARGVYQRGHLYLLPTQATGRFAFSFVDYPALQKEWIPREPMSLVNGLVAGTNGHGGFMPRMEVHYKNGYVTEVKGGGPYGELLKELMQYPKINELTYPHHTHPGFFYLYEIALGTHPKWYRNPEADSLGPERNRSGVYHFGLGLRLWHDPDSPVYSKSWMDFTAKYNLPRDHDFHIHTYFTTYAVHLRNADRWVNITDRGHLTSLDNPEVRALVSRYGDPSRILAEDWSPEIPGINATGRYEDYARDPWSYAKAVLDRAVNGTYAHYYPPVKTPRPAGGR